MKYIKSIVLLSLLHVMLASWQSPATTYVYISTGSGAYAYHLYYNCQHLKRCIEEGHVKKVALEELRRKDGSGYTRPLCKTCEKRAKKNNH
ncbi:MAG: hypothetical protein IKX36_05140 [Prevotella sp.]|nr:hypothetical protein [Prevotella sp.]